MLTVLSLAVPIAKDSDGRHSLRPHWHCSKLLKPLLYMQEGYLTFCLLKPTQALTVEKTLKSFSSWTWCIILLLTGVSSGGNDFQAVTFCPNPNLIEISDFLWSIQTPPPTEWIFFYWSVFFLRGHISFSFCHTSSKNDQSLKWNPSWKWLQETGDNKTNIVRPPNMSSSHKKWAIGKYLCKSLFKFI